MALAGNQGTGSASVSPLSPQARGLAWLREMGGCCSPGAVLELVQDPNVVSCLSCSFSCFQGAVIPDPVPL